MGEWPVRMYWERQAGASCRLIEKPKKCQKGKQLCHVAAQSELCRVVLFSCWHVFARWFV